MKKRVLFYVLFFSACTPTSTLIQSRWSGKGEPPRKPSFSGILKEEKAQTSNAEEVKLSQQTVDGFVVDGSFHKSVSQKDRGLVFQSFSLVKSISPAQLLSASLLNKDKDQIWSDFIKAHPIRSSEKLIFPLQVTFINSPRFFPVIRAYTETALGLIRTIDINKNHEIISDKFVGSALTDMIESPSFAFILGPKKSSLTSILVNRKSLPEGLADLVIAVSSASPAKITLNGSLEYPLNDDRFDQVQAFYYSHQMIQWFNQKAGIQIPNRVQILTHLGYPEKTNAAFYFQNQIRLGKGDDITYSNIAWDPTIVMHETSHAVIDTLTRLPFQGEGGSINEGFADTFTTFYSDNPLLGENSYLLAPYKRTVDQNLKLRDKNGGLYHDSAIVSGFFWSLKKQLASDKVLSFAVRVLNRLGPNSGWQDFKLSLQEQSLEIFSEEELKKVQQLMKERDLL